MNNVERNAACPCGSGKPYKFCHGKSNIIPFPGLRPESLTVEEANDILTKSAETANNIPRDEFLGLSPHQMHALLHGETSAAGIVEVDFDAVDSTAEAVPLQRLAVWLLQWLSKKEVKLTSAGYLPPLVAKLWWEETLMRLDFWGEEFEFPVRKESDSTLLIDVRTIFDSLGLTKVRSGALSLTKKGREFLRATAKEQYARLYSALSRSMNWDDLKWEHMAQPHPRLQQSWFFSLFLLHRFEVQGIEPAEAARLWLSAFPLVVKAYGPTPSEEAAQSLRQSLAAMVEIYSFEFMPRLLGLVD